MLPSIASRLDEYLMGMTISAENPSVFFNSFKALVNPSQKEIKNAQAMREIYFCVEIKKNFFQLLIFFFPAYHLRHRSTLYDINLMEANISSKRS